MKFLTTRLRKVQTSGLYLFAITYLLIGSLVHASPNSHSALGINSNEIVDFDSSIPFIDIFKTSLPFEEARPWLTKGENIIYDEHGWPKKLNGGQVGTRFLYKLTKDTVPEGHYTVLYDGEGILTYSDDATLVTRKPGKDIIKITAGKDNEFRVKLIIKNSNAKNYLRNIRVLMPGGVCSNNPFKRVNTNKDCRGSHFLSFEQHHKRLIFNPDYLNYMKNFKVIRFMGMSGITRNPLSTWDKRPKLNNATWAGKQGTRGAPLEIMVALANKLNADPWFNIPHKANNDFVQRYAQYVKKNLKPGLKTYIEYTNEAWNTIFDQAHYVKDQGERLQLDTDRDKAGYKYFSVRSIQIFDIWEKAYGGTDRIVRVMGSWAGWTRISEMLLSYRNAYKKTDAVAIAPYFYPKLASAKKAKSVEQLFQLMYDPKEKYSIQKVLGYINKNAQIAKTFGVDLIAYEGGQHLVDWKSRNVDKNPTKLMIAANKHWRMAKAYTDFMNGWKENDGKLFVNFSAPRTYEWFGSWGTKEYITQPISKAPKHRSLMEFSRKNPCWWRGCSSRQIARLKKPSNNPIGDVFALVKSKPKKNKKIVIARNARSVIGTKIPSNTTKKSVVTTAKKTISTTRVITPLAKSVATASTNKVISAKAIWDTTRIASNTALKALPKTSSSRKKHTITKSRSNKKVVVKNTQKKNINRPKHVKEKPKQAIRANAIAHRIKGKGRIWSNKATIRLRNVVEGKIRNGRDLSAVWQSHWDNKYLYVRVDAIDDKFIRDSQQPWSDDSVELFIDADGSRTNIFDGKNDFHLIYRWKDKKVNLSNNSPRRGRLDIQQTMTRTNKGYSLETAIPWKTLGVKPIAGKTIGLDVQINDDDSGNNRDGKLSWYAKNNNAWKNPRNFGRVVLGI